MRIISWNVRRAGAASPVWKYLLDAAPDLALLQEVRGLPDEITSAYECCTALALAKGGDNQHFSTVILVRGHLASPVHLCGSVEWVSAELDRFAGNLVAREVIPDAGPPLKVISVHSPAWPVDRARLAGLDVSDVKLTQNPDVWVADLLWAALRNQDLSGPWVVAGDFNASETFDQWRGGPRGNREYLDRMAGLGLVECLRTSQGRLTPTFRNRDKVTVAHQMDHLFVTQSLAASRVFCCTGPQDVIFGKGFSDHLPVIADFACR